jgi:integrase
MPVKKLKNGKWQADIQDGRRGLARTRRVFATKKEALEWEAHVRQEAQDILLGRRKRRTFGEALARYLADIAPHKKSWAKERPHVIALRWPFWAENRFVWLEHVPLEAPGDQLSIVTAMSHWRADMRQVIRRAYIGAVRYQLRRTPRGDLWYMQPAAEGDAPPRPRQLVTDPDLIAKLNANKGSGPYSADTIRIRRSIVRTVLRYCWTEWNWIGADLRTKIGSEKRGPGRQLYLTDDQLKALFAAAQQTDYGQHLADAILAAALIVWRRSNILEITWDNVHWPQYDQGGREIQFGYLTMPGDETKTSRFLGQPMSRDVLAILQRRHDARNGPLVFHRGDGQAFGNFRKTWISIKRTAGIDPGFRWHDLRHTWASRLVQAGASDRHLMELGGWTSPAMPKTYAHLRLDHLRDVVELPAKKKS